MLSTSARHPHVGRWLLRLPSALTVDLLSPTSAAEVAHMFKVKGPTDLGSISFINLNLG